MIDAFLCKQRAHNTTGYTHSGGTAVMKEKLKEEDDDRDDRYTIKIQEHWRKFEAIMVKTIAEMVGGAIESTSQTC